MFDKNLVDAIIGGKDLDRGSTELSVCLGLTKLGLTNLVLTRGHGSLLLHPSFFLYRPHMLHPNFWPGNIRSPFLPGWH
jgi:hypothetical protein